MWFHRILQFKTTIMKRILFIAGLALTLAFCGTPQPTDTPVSADTTTNMNQNQNTTTDTTGIGTDTTGQ